MSSSPTPSGHRVCGSTRTAASPSWSSVSDVGLFTPIFTTDALVAATGGRAWLQAMLDVERALAAAGAEVGVIPVDAAAAIAAACHAERFDADEIGHAGRLGGTPVIPLVAALRIAAGEEAADWVHWGATSQDVLDSAAMLVVSRASALIDGDLARVADACAVLTEEHRGTLMAGRTLLQHA